MQGALVGQQTLPGMKKRPGRPNSSLSLRERNKNYLKLKKENLKRLKEQEGIVCFSTKIPANTLEKLKALAENRKERISDVVTEILNNYLENSDNSIDKQDMEE